ncbi:hypothetical protein LTR99_004862 [Exophiala xenobiotica]|uniref:Uncharacterized protein n=1 Tax=Vermiconidia calcicola TaxID=1690605 RepID=A0AAV9QF24_9PEZI|nr:hypothetical protein LTR96_008852 [Exophiala xenobiotica]KAK5540142.1 hypothetical protein LTR25_003847 [Vermiconidia calcicola]KAK5543233.1 hypothetical protein LTR23_004996 [Chaetothyriales sp. CCFEE 6169]KAK5304406.1 hypothetical protein LTR99_004862 [Exophiala xenobiotica]KAK5339014.1 hypothetical protein LTR98_005414 [Exophiala xenobiotica]
MIPTGSISSARSTSPRIRTLTTNDMIHRSSTSSYNMPNSTNPAITAYRVYHMGQTKLDIECRRQTPDLHKIVAHASIVDSVRRWSRDIAEPSETVLVDSSSDEDSDPYEDGFEDDDDKEEDPVRAGDVAIFDCDVGVDAEDEDHHVINSQQTQTKSFEINAGIVQHVENKTISRTPLSPKRRPPPPPSSKYEFKDQSWRQNRPIMVSETAIEVDEDD